MKPVIIGQAPGPNSGPTPFDGLSGDRLARYMGFEGRGELRTRVDLMNVLKSYPGPKGSKGDAFPLRRARRGAQKIARQLHGRRVLLAGKQVARAFGVRTGYFQWSAHEKGFEVAVIPHPSGVNHWWNDRANRLLFATFVQAILEP